MSKRPGVSEDPKQQGDVVSTVVWHQHASPTSPKALLWLHLRSLPEVLRKPPKNKKVRWRETRVLVRQPFGDESNLTVVLLAMGPVPYKDEIRGWPKGRVHRTSQGRLAIYLKKVVLEGLPHPFPVGSGRGRWALWANESIAMTITFGPTLKIETWEQPDQQEMTSPPDSGLILPGDPGFQLPT